jgi:hypothetical protein
MRASVPPRGILTHLRSSEVTTGERPSRSWARARFHMFVQPTDRYSIRSSRRITAHTDGKFRRPAITQS